MYSYSIFRLWSRLVTSPQISIDKAKVAQVPNNEIRTRNKTRKGEERSAVM